MLTQLGATETLLNTGPDGDGAPGLATEWQQVDPRTWRFTLRPGVTFHDGTPMTGAAVASALTWVAGVSAPPRAIKGIGLQATADGDGAVLVSTTDPDPILPLRLTSPSTAVLAPSAYTGDGPPAVLGTGTGPMRLVTVEGTQSAALERNDAYWGGRPLLASVRATFVPDPSARALAFRAGDADIAVGLPEPAVLELQATEGVEIQDVPAPRTVSLFLNQSAAPFSDIRVREAVRKSIDRTALAEQALAGAALPASDLFGPAVPWGSTQAPPAPDLDGARALLEQAGFGPANPLTVRLWTYPNRPELPVLTTAVQAMLAEAGITAEIQVGEYASAGARGAGRPLRHVRALPQLPHRRAGRGGRPDLRLHLRWVLQHRPLLLAGVRRARRRPVRRIGHRAAPGGVRGGGPAAGHRRRGRAAGALPGQLRVTRRGRVRGRPHGQGPRDCGAGEDRRMTATLARRLLPLPLVLLVASVLVFLLPRLAGIDTTRAVLRARTAESVPDPAVAARITRELGLDGSLAEQYVRWLGTAVRGDLGLSFSTRTPVAPQLLSALGVSVLLTALALGLAAAVGIPAGVYAARRRGGRLDRVVTGVSVLGVAVPEFVLAPVLVLAFAVALPVLPAAGWSGPSAVVLPAVTLALFPMALAAQLTRAEMVDVLQRPHIVVARAKGLSPRRVLWVHAARTALTSVTALSGIFFAGMLGGAVVVEVVFALPGLGRLLYDAVIAQDLPMIQAGLLMVIAIAVVSSAAADGVQLACDPVARSREAV